MSRDVIVVGAGPVGLMLAGELALGGADVVVYERLTAPARESRGASFTKRTAECFDQRGLLGGLGPTEPADAHFGGVPIDLEPLAEDHYGHRGVPQFRTERMLEEWVTGLGVEILRGHEVTAFEESAEAVTVSFTGPDGQPGAETAAYVVGCDGGRSSVRKLAGIDFPGTEGTRGFLTADVTGIETRKRRIGENLPGGSMIMAMDLENGVTRVVVHEAGTPPRDRASLTYTDLADAWQRLTGESLHHGECRWISCFTDASRAAATYRRGRVLLAGDSAHIQPPAMAQGLSVGVQDAVNLGWKLAATVTGRAPEGLLDTYDAERRPIGEQLARNARAAIELRLTGEDMDPVREIVGELVRHEGAAEHLAGMLSNLGVRYDLAKGDHPLLGLRLPPERRVVLADGTQTRVADLLRTGRGLLITADPALARTAEGLDDRLDVVTGTWAEAPEPALDAVLVRPDGYVAWTSPGTVDALTDALARWFGTAEQR